jgi:hypothetical protein
MPRKEIKMNKDEIDCLACPINMVCDEAITFGSIYCQQARKSLKRVQTNAQQLYAKIPKRNFGILERCVKLKLSQDRR